MPNANFDTELKETVALTPALGAGAGLTQRPKAPIPEAQLVQLVVFVLEDETFGADINQVREIIRVGTITPIPDSPHFIKGVANVRGEIVIVIDLKSRFFLQVKKPIEPRHIIIAGQEGNLYGLLVDEVTEVLRISKPEIKTTPHLITRIDRSYVSGVITLENRLIMLLDFKQVLSEEELNKLARLTTAHKEQPIPEPVYPVRDESLNGANLPEQPAEIPLKESPASSTKIVRAAKKALPVKRRRGAR